MKTIIKVKNATNPFYTIMHPFDSSYDIRFRNKGSISVSVIILIIWFFASVMERQNTGYIFNFNKLSDLNIFILLAKVVLPFAMWTCGNWIVSILMNGTGRFRDIWIYSAYCAVPYILGMIVSIFLSNVLVKNEPFAGYAMLFGAGWSLIILFIGNLVMHEYGFKENIAACLFSIGAMAIILFLAMLVGNLYTEFINFIRIVVNEILFRL